MISLRSNLRQTLLSHFYAMTGAGSTMSLTSWVWLGQVQGEDYIHRALEAGSPR